MKRNIFILTLAISLLFIAGKSSADQPPEVPSLNGVVFWIEVACQDSDLSINQLREWCEEEVDSNVPVGDLWGTPPILTICPLGQPNPQGPNRIVPNGSNCGTGCGEGFVEVSCSVRLIPD